MSIFFGSLKNEYLKLAHRKKYIVFLIIEVLICICAMLIQFAATKVLSGNVVMQINDMARGMLTFFIQVYIPLIIFMACSDLFSTEMQDNSIKAILMRPVSRFKVFFSKTLAIIIFAAQYLIALLLITTVLSAISGGSISGFWLNLLAYLLDIFPTIVLVLMAVLINQFTKSSSLTMFLCILIYAILNVLGIIFPTASGLFFTGYMQWHKLWLGFNMPFTAMLSKIGILFGYGLVFAGAGFYLFDRRDF